ncbi:hypothetical protein EOL96_00960 [Candidatus Saccharibacteria bacterium]|nr:hypothetical protein [Candidatus Saccharibacteria bacterium]
MKQILAIGTIAALFFMAIIGLAEINTGFHLFMNTTSELSVVRIMLGLILLAVLIVKRPRSRLARIVLAVIATIVIVYAILQSLSYSPALFDTVAFFLVGLLLFMESLEPSYDLYVRVPIVRPIVHEQ